MNLIRVALMLLFLGFASEATASQSSLRGSRHSVRKQAQIANAHGYSELRTNADIRKFVEQGYLVPIRSSTHFDLSNVAQPYTRPEVKLFVERLSSQYQAACDEKLVITSLTRALNEQPPNASKLSVHPRGMAIDLRIPRKTLCQKWLARNLSLLEAKGVIEATRERRPPHYHVAVFPIQYKAYLEQKQTSSPRTHLESKASGVRTTRIYRVKPGESLWSIARSHNTTVAQLKKSNALRSDKIVPGQRIKVPP